MDQKCKSCGKIVDATLVVCPSCGNPPTQEPKLELNPEQSKQVAKQVEKDIRTTVLFWLGFISLLTGFGVWQAYRAGVEEMKGLLVQRISKEFEQPQIKETVSDVAQNQAATLLKNEINPEVTKFKSETGEKIKEFGDFLTEHKARYEADYALLQRELAILKQRNEIGKLRDNGILWADRASFDHLENIATTNADRDIRVAAAAEKALIKSRWRSGSSVKPGRHTINGKHETDLKTNELIEVLLTDKNSNNRLLAAWELANRRQKGVPDALLVCIENDQNLEVVRNAMEAFEATTGFLAPDIFKYAPAKNWWDEHKEEVNAKLTEQK